MSDEIHFSVDDPLGDALYLIDKGLPQSLDRVKRIKKNSNSFCILATDTARVDRNTVTVTKSIEQSLISATRH